MRGYAKFGILAGLYFSQGLPFGFFREALPALMRQREATLPQIGLASLLTLPWALKFLWAPLVDKYGIRRIGMKKSWILLLQLAAVVLFIGMGLAYKTEDYGYLMWGFLLASLIAATQDIASDGLAVGMLLPHERGLGNGLQYSGYRLGMIFGGGVLLIFIAQLGWSGAFFAMSLALALVTVPLFFYSEPAAPSQPESEPAWHLLGAVFAKKGFAVWLLLIGFYKFGDAMISQMLRPLMVDFGLELADIGKILGTAGSVGGLLGGLGGGLMLRYWGRFRTIVWLGIVQALAVVAYIPFSRGMLDADWLYAICFIEHFTGGMATAALFTVMMDVCDPGKPSTDYTVQASFVVISTSAANVLGGFLAGGFGYAVNFTLSGILSLAGAMAFVFKFGRDPKRNQAFSLQRAA